MPARLRARSTSDEIRINAPALTRLSSTAFTLITPSTPCPRTRRLSPPVPEQDLSETGRKSPCPEVSWSQSAGRTHHVHTTGGCPMPVCPRPFPACPPDGEVRGLRACGLWTAFTRAPCTPGGIECPTVTGSLLSPRLQLENTGGAWTGVKCTRPCRPLCKVRFCEAPAALAELPSITAPDGLVSRVSVGRPPRFRYLRRISACCVLTVLARSTPDTPGRIIYGA